MRILAPLNHTAEIDPLIEAGADEFYAGYVSPLWLKRFTVLSSPNRRAFLAASFTDLAELTAAATLLKIRGKPLYLTLNRAFYSAAQYPLLLDEIRVFKELGVSGFIVADFELMLLIRESGLDVSLHLSSLAPVLNAHTAAFYERFGVKRITLPRSLTTEEINSITAANPSLSFDVFIGGGKCINVEGYCSFFHVNPDRSWPCVQDYAVMPQTRSTAAVLEAELLWQQCPRYLACGLCALGKLEKARVTGLKVVGRSARLENKLRLVRLVKKGLASLESTAAEDFCKTMLRLYETTYGRSCSPQLCYYPYEGFR